MTVPDLDTGDAIVETWVDAVAVDVNGQDGRLDALEAPVETVPNETYGPLSYANATGAAAICKYRIRGDVVEFWIAFTAGTATASGTVGINIPWSLATDAGTGVDARTSTGKVAGCYASGTSITLWKDHAGGLFAATDPLAPYRLYGSARLAG